MGLNFLLLVVGLVICFGGIYIRKVCSAALGLIWGAICSFAVILMTVGLWGLDDETTAIIIMCAVLCAIISVINDKLCAVINAFLSSFFLVAILLLMADSVENATLITIAAIIALIISIITVKIYDYSFIIITAFSGAFIASVGGCGIAYNEDASDVLLALMFGDEVTGFILIGTIVLGVLGCIVQWRRLKGKKVTSGNTCIDISDASSAVKHSRFAQWIKTIDITEIKENWVMLIAPCLTSLIWTFFLFEYLEYRFGMYLDVKRLINYVPEVVYALLCGASVASLIISVKNRSKSFCAIWQAPFVITAAIKLVHIISYTVKYHAVRWYYDSIVIYIASFVKLFIPLLAMLVVRVAQQKFRDTFNKPNLSAKANITMSLLTSLVWYLGEKLSDVTSQLIRHGFVFPESLLANLVLIGIGCIALFSPMLANNIQKEMEQDSAFYARCRGLSEGKILLRYALPNAVVTLLPSFCQMLGLCMAGSAIVERVFSLPGLGYLIIDSVLYRDSPVIHATILFLAFSLVMFNILSDILRRILQRDASAREGARL